MARCADQGRPFLQQLACTSPVSEAARAQFRFLRAKPAADDRQWLPLPK